MKFLGPKFTEQTPESFHAYAKDVHKFQNIKRPEAVKPKVKKAKKTNGKHDDNSRPVTSSDNSRKTKTDVENLENAGWQDSGGNQFLITIAD